MTNTLAELKDELRATQYWIEELYALHAQFNCREIEQLVRHRVLDAKNESPPANVSAEIFDKRMLPLIPHIERIGNRIADRLGKIADMIERDGY